MWPVSDDVPNLGALDMELAEQVRGKLTPALAAKAGISVMGVWGLHDHTPAIWILDSSRFPRIYLAEDDCQKRMEKYDGIVTWNGLEFDDPVAAKRIPNIRKTWMRKAHVDLHAICCLCAAGVDLTGRKVGQGWAKLAMTIRDDILTAGWGLDAVGRATLGIGKTEGVQGLASLTAWSQGRYGEVITYNLGDVALTRLLYLHAWTEGFLVSPERGRVEIPRWLLS